MLIFAKGDAVNCNAERLTLAEARRERAEARLRELIESEKALVLLERFGTRSFYDWTNVRHARRDVLCWEARCNRAQVALKECLQRNRAASSL